MTRVALTDGSGAWFNRNSSIRFHEATRWDGRNQISVPTGSQWDHERLYFTKSGKWVLNSFSNYQGSLETYTQIDQDEAITWLVQNDHGDSDKLTELPASVRDAVETGVSAAEI
jgi:hypothetical protein